MTLYLVERDFGKNGTEVIGYREYTRSKVIDLIAKGEWPNLIRVLEVIEDEGSVRDVTEDMQMEAAHELV